MGEYRKEPDRPKQIGPYKILDVLGEGGMAVVYLAEQQRPVHRRVALKVLKLGMDTRRIIARFESERQALAVLDHPNIAKIYEGGVTDDGRPFFAMELVKGAPITEYCDDHRLDTESRVQLFIDVCKAVQHAHHKGLIHRDLKPSNILVGVSDQQHVVKIIDFGIAKATSADMTDKTIFTRIGQLVGTPQYMSPEQADISGIDVDTRTDIYSMGVVLYELLTGVPPIQFGKVADQAVRHALREVDPPRPSTRFATLENTQEEVARARQADPTSLRKKLAGDLDWIVMKAIAKDRTRRYETANALAVECSRYLRHEPVIARSPRVGYLLGRFVRRNRVSVAFASVAIVAVLAGAAAATVGMVRAIHAEQEARLEAETSRLVSDFLADLFEVSDPYFNEQASTDITAQDLLVRGADRLEDELVDRPDIQARLMNIMGGVFISLGDYDRSEDLIERALKIRNTRPDSRDVELAGSYYNLGRLRYEKGEYDLALAALNEALEHYSRANGPDSLHVAQTLEFQSSIAAQQSRFADVRDALTRAAEIRKQHPESNPVELANSMSSLGLAYFSMGDHPAARDAFAEAVENYSKGSKSGAYARAVGNLASINQLLGDYEKAIDGHLEALKLKKEVFGPDHVEVATSLNNLGGLYRDRGEFTKAEEAVAEALEIFRAALGPDHGNVGVVMIVMGHLLREVGRYSEAETFFVDALPILENVFGEGSIRVIQAYNGHAYSRLLQGDFVAAEALFTKLIPMAEALDEEHPELGIAYSGQASIEGGQLSPEQREHMFLDAIRILDKTAGPENRRSIDARIRYARFLRSTGRASDASELYGSALAALEASLGTDHEFYRRRFDEYSRDFQ